jgi:hypothetical protein
MSVKQSVERLAGETEVLGENLLQCRFFHQISHMTWPGLEPGRRGGKQATNRLSYGTTFLHIPHIRSIDAEVGIIFVCVYALRYVLALTTKRLNESYIFQQK